MRPMTAGQCVEIISVFKDLPSDVVQDVIDSGLLKDIASVDLVDYRKERIRERVREALGEPKLAPNGMPVWAEVTTGTVPEKADEFVRQISAAGVGISTNVSDRYLETPGFWTARLRTQKLVKLIVVSLDDLNINPGSVLLDSVCEKAHMRNLHILPQESALLSALQVNPRKIIRSVNGSRLIFFSKPLKPKTSNSDHIALLSFGVSGDLLYIHALEVGEQGRFTCNCHDRFVFMAQMEE